ncbi:cancer-related nucleoside-triphosphatase homolog isoform X2 [Medicago truncatula]|uniref:cancer-related nucleoside-triphosphatase homolog isoform X2 n=1 Tax=Medicago truncatula TaxID=3880 RepID=UPI000D2F327F|nr:cancer-related nucleoside-triphosphatase homolog isoform X2 [Medicago truncatula]
MVGTGKCFLVTGPPGVGKSTLIMRVFESLKASNPTLKVQGFYTLRVAGERVGFEVVTLDGRTCPLASSNFSSQESHRWPNVGKYKVDVASFESLALLELQVREDTDLFIIDEVGKMELYSSSFFPAVLKVLESNIPILASIPVPKFGRDIPADGTNLSRDLIGRNLEDQLMFEAPYLLNLQIFSLHFGSCKVKESCRSNFVYIEC